MFFFDSINSSIDDLDLPRQPPPAMISGRTIDARPGQSDERQAVLDLEGAEWQGRRVLVRCPKGSTSAVTDRLYGQYDEALTIDGVSGKWIYFGHRHHEYHSLTEGGVNGARWVGGSPKSGYSGAEKPNETCQEQILKFFWS